MTLGDRRVFRSLRLHSRVWGPPIVPLPARSSWAVAWDNVEVECRIGVHRPDIVLRLAGREVGAIEVLVTHEVTAEKAAALRMLGVPWLEIAASDLGFHDTPAGLAWAPGAVLPVYRASKESGQWYCPIHEASRRLMEARRHYQSMKDTHGPAAEALIAQGKLLAASEREVVRLLAQTEAVTRAADDEVARLRALAEELPERIAESGRLLERAKRDFATAEALAAQRTEEALERFGPSALLESDLLATDEELRHYERLRRRLSGEPHEHTTPGQITSDERRTLLWRPMDVYRTHRSPRRHTATRGVFHIERVAVPGKAHELILVEDGNTRHCRVDASQDDAELRLREAFDKRVDEWRRSGAIIDFPCEWVRVPYGQSIPNEAWERKGPVPQAYSWSESEDRWVLPAVVNTPMPGA